ncbi:MAG: hydrogenobyrinic acid a,c-diamide synthase (glutamine-hydrolyzing) [Deltaproteobacteria bacterium]|nr:hydrogenobyrinic acid a,c-diamide synthase (glutamine-hydrolyzing) [Deltaproteobacteria bacterium]
MPRIMITALRGGSGKTIITIGLASTFISKGKKISTFKKGPDFIDAGWLSFASGSPCHNLDPFLMSEKAILDSVTCNSSNMDMALIEGNRGLFDGVNVDGQYSTAELAKLTKSPVIVIVDVTMCTRTVAALIMGCQHFDPELEISGIILNRVAGARQKNLIKSSIEKYCGIPVIGEIPKLKDNPFPERHMGLVPHFESGYAGDAVDWARSVVESHIDTAFIEEIAQKAGHLSSSGTEVTANTREQPPLCRIGIVRDKAFWFYYPENIALLRELGAELVEIDSLTDSLIPDIDALYIGGGFPEVCAEELAENSSFRNCLRDMIENDFPVYAECGGLIYLGKSLEINGNSYPMVDALPVKFIMEKKPQGHGYTILNVCNSNPFYEVGKTIRGHEFHYSRPVILDENGMTSVFKVERGYCLDGKKDGFCKKNLFATYTHIHAAENRSWGQGLFDAAMRYKKDCEKKY